MKKQVNIFQRVMIFFGGFSIAIAKKCNSNTINLLVGISLLLIIPVSFSIIAYTNAAFFITENWKVSLFFGIIGGICIWIIDRSILSFSEKSKFSLSMVGRAVFAVAMSILIAEVLIIGIFKSSIQEQQAREANQVQDSIFSKNAVKIISLNESLKEGRIILNELRDKYTSEADGSSGTMKVNKGPIFKLKYQNYLEYKKEFDKEKKNVDEQIESLRARERSEIKSSQLSKSYGLLAAIRSLNKLAEEEPIVWYAIWVLRIALVFLEITPLLVKLSPIPGMNLYYSMRELMDQDDLEVAKSLSSERRQVLIINERLVLAAQNSDIQFENDKFEILNVKRSLEQSILESKESAVWEAKENKLSSKNIKESNLLEKHLENLNLAFAKLDSSIKDIFFAKQN